MLGLIHVNYALSHVKPVLKNIILFSFGSIFIAYGIIHGAYVAIATSTKLAVQNNLDIESAVLLAKETNSVLRLFVYPIFGLLSILFIH